MNQAPNGSFHLQVLGVPLIKDAEGVTPPALGWGKPLALLCLLAIRGEARREEVVDLLWRDVDEGKAKNAFRQALHRLRGALGDDLIPQDRERIKLVRTPRITIDLDQFEQAAASGRLDAALHLYAGDFLADASLNEPAFDHWAEQERTKIRVAFRHILRNSINESTSSGDWPRAIANAKRLMAAAPFEASAAQLAATTLISAGRRVEAQDLLRQFATRLDSELGLPLPQELQSLTSRIERQERTATAPTTAIGAQPLPFVGRENELSQLMSLWRTTGPDSGALAVIEGDAGIGKTRIVRELVSHAKALGPVLVLSGSERAAGPPLPYGVFAEALRPLARAKGILGASRHLLAESARLLPELRDEIDLPPVSDIVDDAARLRFFEGIAALIDAAAFEQPILMLLEDLQFIPPSSLDLLSYLAVRLAGSPVMFVLTLRPLSADSPVSRRLRALAETSDGGAPPHGARARLLSLAPLSRAAAMTALEAATRAAGVSAQQRERVVARADGNPAQLFELTRRALGHEEITGEIVDARHLVSERVARLSSVQRRMLLSLALIGRAVDVRTLAAAAHVPLSAASETLHDLASLGLAEVEGENIAVAALARESALDAAGENGRTFLAGWVAEALEQDRRTRAGELARLYAIAGVTAKAFEHYRRAALAALSIAAVQESVGYLMSARTFAVSSEQQREVESLLSALGSGRRRIAADRASEAAPTIAPLAGAVVDLSDGWRVLFPNWRLLLGGAIATLVVSAVVLAARPEPIRVTSRALPSDTLVIREGESGRVRLVTTAANGSLALADRAITRASSPAWIDSLRRPWIDPIAAPRGRSVAIARVTARGSDVYVVSADRHDTTSLIAGQGDARPLGWSPDGRWVLAIGSRVLDDRSLAASLFAYQIIGPARVVPIDTLARHAVTEAMWSPDGSRIAWVARAGDGRQLDVFASRADGKDMRNISHDPADDFHIAWSADGDLLAYTSTRDGNAEIYAHSFSENRDWRLTFDNAQDDRAAFSHSGHLVAFESTRGGASGIYVMPTLGGATQRIALGPALAIDAWESGGTRFIDRVRASIRSDVNAGDSATIALAAFDQFDEPIAHGQATWVLLDSSLATLRLRPDSAPRLIARHEGLVRIVGNVGGWRSDTAFVRIGNRRVDLLAGNRAQDWTMLGDPLPTFVKNDTSVALRLNADREWDSGVLSRAAVPIVPGLTLTARIAAPFAGADPATSLSVALVAPEESSAIDPGAPQFLRYAGFSWYAESGRFVYSVGRELFTEQATTAAQSIAFALRVETDSTVSFVVDGRERWRSTLRIQDARHDWRADVWIGGRATTDRATVSALRVFLAPGRSANSR